MSNASGHAAPIPQATVNVAGVSVGLAGVHGSGPYRRDPATTMFENPIPWVTDSGNSNNTSNVHAWADGQRARRTLASSTFRRAPRSACDRLRRHPRVRLHDVQAVGDGSRRRRATSRRPAVGNSSTRCMATTTVFQFTYGVEHCLVYISMAPGSTWYVNVRVQNPAKLSGGCGTDYCDIRRVDAQAAGHLISGRPQSPHRSPAPRGFVFARTARELHRAVARTRLRAICSPLLTFTELRTMTLQALSRPAVRGLLSSPRSRSSSPPRRRTPPTPPASWSTRSSSSAATSTIRKSDFDAEMLRIPEKDRASFLASAEARARVSSTG